MVKNKKIQPEVSKEFVEFRQKIQEAEKKSEDELQELLMKLKPKIYNECLKDIKKAFSKHDNQMMLYDFLAVNNDESVKPGAQIIINSKPPRTPLIAENIFSANGTPIKF